MRKLLLFASLCLAAACGDTEVSDDDVTGDGDDAVAPFCGDGEVNAGEECDDTNSLNGDGCSANCLFELPPLEPRDLAVTWQFRDVAGADPGCPPSVDTAAVRTQLLDGNDDPVGQPVTDLFDCVDAAGLVEDLPGGRQLVYIDFGDADVSPLFGQTLSEIVDLSAGNGAYGADFVVDGGFLAYAWDLVRASTGAVVECSQVEGENGVSALATVSGGTDAFEELYPCEDHFALSLPLLARSYVVSLSALGQEDLALGTAESVNAMVLNRNRVTNLGLIEIPIAGL